LCIITFLDTQQWPWICSPCHISHELVNCIVFPERDPHENISFRRSSSSCGASDGATTKKCQPLLDGLTKHDREGNSFATVIHVLLAEEQRAILCNKVCKHTRKYSTIEPCNNGMWEIPSGETRRVQYNKARKQSNWPLPWVGVSRVHSTSFHWSMSGSGHFFLSWCSSWRYLKIWSRYSVPGDPKES